MNSGAEAVETAIKIARKWGYQGTAFPTAKGSGQIPSAAQMAESVATHVPHDSAGLQVLPHAAAP